MENIKKESMGMFLRMLLAAGGVDIVAPKEVQDSTLKSLGLTGDEGLEYKAVAKVLENVAPEKRVKVVKAVIANSLTPTQLMDVRDYVHESITNIIEYMSEHPEMKENLGPHDVLNRMFNVDLDED